MRERERERERANPRRKKIKERREIKKGFKTINERFLPAVLFSKVEICYSLG